MIRLSQSLADAIRAEGEKTYPHECCGAILGELDEMGHRVAHEILPIHNARETEEQYHRFRIEANDFLRTEEAARQKKFEVLGFYHSHPDHPARPSGYDQEYALPFYSYLIVSVAEGRAKNLTSWNLRADRSQFDEEIIQGAR
ncbi:MAG: M67 family metallopeptidase [Zoogloeaceae bacterium]|jgi:proteasome lid subunit RPN8/RPN11|nr:M67 family metallopeptidase [Zoogloeaceae bacterium]